uniref:Uncharacterized protein n=1 Tax=Oryza glumipatula TaxID=40148 RepID=A0A0E0AK32_9ORYZ
PCRSFPPSAAAAAGHLQCSPVFSTTWSRAERRTSCGTSSGITVSEREATPGRQIPSPYSSALQQSLHIPTASSLSIFQHTPADSPYSTLHITTASSQQLFCNTIYRLLYLSTRPPQHSSSLFSSSPPHHK